MSPRLLTIFCTLAVTLPVLAAPKPTPPAKPSKVTKPVKAPTAAQLKAQLNQQLFEASKKGDVKRMETLIKQGANVNETEALFLPDGDGKVQEYVGGEPLLYAIEARSLPAVKLLLKHGADANMNSVPSAYKFIRESDSVIDSDHMTPLGLALATNQAEMVKVLLAAGAGEDPYYVLSYPTAHNSVEAAKALLDWYKSEDQRIAASGGLFWAVLDDRLEILQLLLSYPVDKEELNDALVKAFDFDRFEMASLLLKAGADAKLKNEEGESVLDSLIGSSWYPSRVVDKEKDKPLPAPEELRTQYQDITRLLIAKGAELNPVVARSTPPLLIAVGQGDVEKVAFLLELGADPRKLPKDAPSALRLLAMSGQVAKLRAAQQYFKTEIENLPQKLEAAMETDAAMARLLFAKGASPELGEEQQALPEAVLNENTELAKLLLEHGAKPNVVYTPSKKGRRPVNRYYLSAYDQISSLDEDAQLPLLSNNGLTPLLLAAAQGNAEIVELLVAKGADPNARNAQGQNALLMLAEQGQTVTIAEQEQFQLESGIRSPYDNRPPYKMQRMLPAPQFVEMLKRSAAADSATARALINAGTSVNAPDRNGKTPLQAAVSQGSLALLAVLLESGANVNGQVPLLIELVNNGRRQSRTQTALTTLQLDLLQANQLEVNKKSVPILSKLRQRAYDARAQLLLTWGTHDAEVASQLIKQGIKVNERDKFGLTPLMRAVRTGQLEVTQTLIQNGADVNATDNDGFTVLMQAIIYGQRRGELFPPTRSGEKPITDTKITAKTDNSIRFILESHNRHSNAIRQMWGREDAAIVKLLLDNKANKATKDKQGRTAADLAKQVNHSEALAVLQG